MTVSLKKTEPTGEFLDARAFGELIDLSRESVYRAIARGDLRAVRIGRAIRLPRAQLDALLAEGERGGHAPERPAVMVECADDC
jgi:excisionase family DNA binding protein